MPYAVVDSSHGIHQWVRNTNPLVYVVKPRIGHSKERKMIDYLTNDPVLAFAIAVAVFLWAIVIVTWPGIKK